MLIIGVTKRIAGDLKIIPVVSQSLDMKFYLSVFKVGRTVYNLLIHEGSFYTEISKGREVQSLIVSSAGCDDFQFGVISDSSLRSKIQAVTAKAKSIVERENISEAEVVKTLNGIPWKFLGFRAPNELNG